MKLLDFVFLVSLFSCSAATNASLSGTWVAPCAATGSGSQKESYHFDGLTTCQRSLTYFSDSACKSQLYSASASGTYSVTSSYLKTSIRDSGSTLSQVEVKPLSTDGATYLNRLNLGGLTNWQSGTPQSLPLSLLPGAFQTISMTAGYSLEGDTLRYNQVPFTKQ